MYDFVPHLLYLLSITNVLTTRARLLEASPEDFIQPRLPELVSGQNGAWIAHRELGKFCAIVEVVDGEGGENTDKEKKDTDKEKRSEERRVGKEV